MTVNTLIIFVAHWFSGCAKLKLKPEKGHQQTIVYITSAWGLQLHD